MAAYSSVCAQLMRTFSHFKSELFRFALSLNVGGTLRVVQLCRKLPCLKALVHVSTAYANCDLPFIEEQVYPPPVDPHKLLDALE